MATDRRRAVATATTGAGLTAAGGVLRQQALHAAHGGKHPPSFSWRHPVSTHQTRALLRTGARGRRRYLLGATLGLVGAPALAVGLHDTFTAKRDDRRTFVEEGLRGTQDALEQRAQGVREVPPQHRVGPLAVSAGAGAVGSWGTHLALNRTKMFTGRHHGGRAGLAALGGTTAAALSYPLARRVVRSSEYEVTPAGVRRKKSRPVRPSSKSTSERSMPRSFQEDLQKSDLRLPPALPAIRRHTRSEYAVRQKRNRGRFAKADSYSGRRTPVAAQRAAILAAGSTPVIGGIAGARTAGHFAPPGERMHTEVRQYGLTAAGAIGGGVAGAYGTTALARKHPGVARASERVADVHARATGKVRNLKPVNAAIARMPKNGAAGRAVARGRAIARESKIAGPLRHAPAAALAGYVAGKTVGGFAGSGMAMRHNQRDQREFNLKHPVVKYAENMTVAERRKLSRKKRYAAASSTTTGVLGLGALAARAKGKPDLALNMLTGSAAIGGVNNLNFAGVLRREAKAQSPDVKKGLASKTHMAWHNGGSACGYVTMPRHRLTTLWSKVTCPGCKRARTLMSKADRHREPLTRMHADTAADLVRRHGDAGPLPKELSREDRMRAYEARYVHAGGHKAERWQRRADTADKIKTGGVAGATLGGVGILALRHPRVGRALGSRLPAARHATDSAAITAATVSGAGELYAGHARRRRASYSNSKAGVAASALRRMKDYAA